MLDLIKRNYWWPEISTEQSVTYEENRKTLSIGDTLRTMTGN